MRWIKLFSGIACYLLIAAMLIIVVSRGCREHNRFQTIKRSVSAVYDSTHHYRDLYNTEHAKRDEVIADKLEADLLYRQMLDSVCRRIGIKDKQLVTYARMLAEARGDITTVMDTVHDTVMVPGVKPAVRLMARLDDTLLHGWATYYPATKRFRLQYDLALDLRYTRYWKRRWFLGRKHWKVDVYSELPNVHVKGVTGITIK